MLEHLGVLPEQKNKRNFTDPDVQYEIKMMEKKENIKNPNF